MTLSIGDALIMGSDGLWDNVPAAEAAGVCAALVKEGKGAQEVAEAIATVAFDHSVDEVGIVHFFLSFVHFVRSFVRPFRSFLHFVRSFVRSFVTV